MVKIIKFEAYAVHVEDTLLHRYLRIISWITCILKVEPHLNVQYAPFESWLPLRLNWTVLGYDFLFLKMKPLCSEVALSFLYSIFFCCLCCYFRCFFHTIQLFNPLLFWTLILSQDLSLDLYDIVSNRSKSVFGAWCGLLVHTLVTQNCFSEDKHMPAGLPFFLNPLF